MTQGYRRALACDAARTLARRDRLVRRRRAGRALLHAAQVRALAHRGSRRRVRARDRSAGIDAAVHRGSDQADRGVLFADSRGRRVHGDLRISDGGRRQRGAALEAVGGAHEEAAADRRRAAAQVRRDSRRDRVSDQSAVARTVVPVDAGRIHRDVAGSVPRAPAHRRPVPGRGPEVSGRAEPPDRPAPQHAGSARQHQPRQAFRRRRRRRYGGPHAGDDAGRAPGHALQEGRRAVRRDRPGRAARPDDAGGHQRCLRAGARRQHGAAVQSRRREGRRRAAVAQPLQPAARGQGHRRRWRRVMRSTRRSPR